MADQPTPMHRLIANHGDAVRASGVFTPGHPTILLPEGAVPSPGGGEAPRFDRRVLPALALLVSGDRGAEDDPVTANAWARGIARRFEGLSRDYRYVVLIHGAAEGIDTIAHMIGSAYDFVPLPMPFIPGIGRAGGPKRNEAMLKVQHALSLVGYDRVAILCHPNLTEGGSRGTLNVKRLLDRAGDVPVEVYASPEEMDAEARP